MPFSIIRGDITTMAVDAIVNTANPRPIIGAGTDAGIHAKAGPGLLEARKQIGAIPVGQSAMTPGFSLNARYVIHTVGPVWRGGLFGEEKKLRACFDSALALALEAGCRSIAFPLISTGNYGFPKDRALEIAANAFRDFLRTQEMDIILVVFNKEAYRISRSLFQQVESYIDEHYVRQVTAWEYGQEDICFPAPRRCQEQEAMATMPCMEQAESCEAAVDFGEPFPTLEELLAHADAGFSETLLRRIDESGKKDAEIYKKANLSRQHFSKIRNNPGYKPTKATALALALALELNLEETRDLIGRAGYALTNSSKFDLIVRYFIERGVYDVMQINMTLYEFDQSLLGN